MTDSIPSDTVLNRLWLDYCDADRGPNESAPAAFKRIVGREIEELQKKLSARLQQIEELRMAERLNVETVANFQKRIDDLERTIELVADGLAGVRNASDEDAVDVLRAALDGRTTQPPNASRIIEFRDDDGDEVTVCPTCGQSHIGSSREELRKTLGLSLTKEAPRCIWRSGCVAKDRCTDAGRCTGSDPEQREADLIAHSDAVEKEALPLCDCDTDTGCKEYRQDKFRCANEEAERASPETRARPACTCELDADMCLIHG